MASKRQNVESSEVRLRKQQILGEEAEYWRAPFAVVEYKPGDSYWVARIADAQVPGDFPMWRVTAAKRNRARVTPEMVVLVVETELAEHRGRVFVTEVKDGIPIYNAAFEVGRTWGVQYRLCYWSTNHERCPVAEVPSEAEQREIIDQAQRARRSIEG